MPETDHALFYVEELKTGRSIGLTRRLEQSTVRELTDAAVFVSLGGYAWRELCGGGVCISSVSVDEWP